MKRTILFFLCFLLTVILLVFTDSKAQWWRFGRQKDVPEITKLYLGDIDARDIDDEVTITPSNLRHGVLYIKGKARVRKGKIAKVKISFDGGKTWVSVKVKEGSFMYKFTPQIGRDYHFQIYAIDTTGRKSDPHEYDFRIHMRPEVAKEVVRETFEKMLQAYMKEDLSGFMKYVSDDFQGDISVLEDALEKDFRYFDNIKIYTSISRITKRGKYYDLCFRYNRQVTSTKTGRILKDSSYSCASFELRDNKVKLVKLMAPLIFGVSEPEDVATAVAPEAVGTKVITVSDQGSVAVSEQGEKVETTEEQQPAYESVCLNAGEGFDFDTENKAQGGQGADIAPHMQGILFFGSAPHGIVKMPQTDLDAVRSCPTGGYQGEVWNVMPGDIYCVWTNGGTYAKMKVTSFIANQQMCIEYAISKKNSFK